MNDAIGVHVRESLTQLPDDGADRNLSKAAVPLKEVLAITGLDKGQHERDRAAPLKETVEADYVR
eukprot:scaffold178848_cov32-Tisochrysis_lutea.AAC.1